MDTPLYTNGGGAVKPHVPPKVQILPPRPRLAGRAHTEGWDEQARALRALLKAIYPRCPSHAPKGGHEAVTTEAIEHIYLLDKQGLNLFRFLLAVLVKLSVH